MIALHLDVCITGIMVRSNNEIKLFLFMRLESEFKYLHNLLKDGNMSESNKTETMTNSTTSSSNTQKDTTIEKKEVKNNNEADLTKSKEQQFQELISWLKKWGYKTKDSTKDNKIEGIEYQAQITPQLHTRLDYPHPCFWNFKRIWMMVLS
jgi:hypothetical protein